MDEAVPRLKPLKLLLLLPLALCQRLCVHAGARQLQLLLLQGVSQVVALELTQVDIRATLVARHRLLIGDRFGDGRAIFKVGIAVCLQCFQSAGNIKPAQRGLIRRATRALKRAGPRQIDHVHPENSQSLRHS